MEDKNYYMQEQIGGSGVANTQNPLYATSKYEPFKLSPKKINVGEYFSSDSKYDESIGDLSLVASGEKTVDDLRAEKQTGLDMFANALVNNVVIAGTTAIEGTLGLANSLFTLSWDNAVNNWAADVQEATRESFPIYRGQEYEDKSLLEKMGTGVFWADLVQNLGYAEGMMIPGMGAAKLLTSAPKIVRNFVPSLIGSIGEASTEAIMAKRDEVENKTRIANEEYNKLAATATSPLSSSIIEAEYMDTLDNIEKDATKAGNFVFGSNVALLTMSNSIQFGNLFSRGFGTTKRLKGALKRKGDIYKTDNLGLSMALEGVKKIGQATTEGIEEVSQAIISNTPSNYTDYNSFNSSIFNPENRELAGNIWQALGQSYAETMQDSNTAVEFATGFIIGALGIPRLRMSKMPITLENNAGVELYNKYQEIKQQQELANEINSRLEQNDKIKEYYNGLVRHLTIQDRMNIALDNQDAYEYKNAESAQFISDIMMFDNVGDLNNLKNIINNSVDFSDEGIDSIIQETSKNGEGPFMTNGNPLDRDIVRDIIKEKIGILNYKIDNYTKDKEALEVGYPDMDTETLGNTLFLRGQIRDHSDRYKDLLDKSFSSIKPLLDKKSAGGISNIDKNTFEVSWITSPKFREEISKVIDKDKATIPFDEKQKIKQDLNDIVKIYDSLETMNKSLKDIITNPNKSKEDIQKNQEEAIKVDNDKKANDFITKASNATSFGEVSDIKTEAYIDDEILNKSNAQVVKDYKKASLYNNSINRVINSMDIEDDVKSNALQLFREQYYSSSTLDELMNPNSVILEDDNILYDDTLSEEDNMIEYQKARQTISYAMNKVNSEESFKNQFSKEIPEVSTEGVPSNNTPQNDITGNSETATVPSVNTKQQGESKVYEAPIGDRTIEQLEEENTNIQSAQEHFNEIRKGKSNNYYRPVIPELHIEASKKGDFRPFNVVVSERESGVNFDTIYNYLRDNGAFTYVNEGNLKPGDELGFMIDPNFNDKTIFIVDKRNNQIVGSLDESEKSMSRFQGLKELSDKVRQEYNQKTAGNKDIILSGTSRKGTSLNASYEYSIDNDGFIKYTFKGDSPLKIIVTPENFGLSINELIGEKSDYQIEDNYNEAVEEITNGVKVNQIVIRPNGEVVILTTGQDIEGKAANIIKDKILGIQNNTLEYRKQKYQYAKSKTETTKINEHTLTLEIKNLEKELTEKLKDKLEKFKNSEEGSKEESLIEEEINKELPEGFKFNIDRIFYDRGSMINSSNIKDSNRKFKVGTLVQVSQDSSYPVGIITEVDNSGRILEVIDEDGNLIVRDGVILTRGESIESRNDFISKKEKSTSSPTVKVSKIMVGKIPYTNTERSLAEIPNVQSEGNPAVFGIIKNGTLFTNGKIEDSKVVKPLDMSNKEGRIYLLIPNAAGKYSPAAIRVKHYNRKEFNPSDVAVQNTKVFKNIQDAVRKLAESSNAEDLSLAVKDLSSSIYTGNLHIDWFDSPNGSGIKISKVERDSNGNEIYDEKDGKRIRREKTKWVYLTENDPNFLGSLIDNNTVVTGDIKKDLDSVIKVINTALLDLNLPIQVNAGIINSGGYNKMLIDSGVLTSNILDARVLGSWFTTDTFNAEEQLEKPTSPTSTIPSLTTNNDSPVGGIESVSNKEVEYIKEELPDSKEALSIDEIVEMEQSLDEISDEFEDDIDLNLYRETSDEYIPWNKEEEIAWLSKVLPQLSTKDRLQFTDGLIKVANKGTYAWGKFNNGIITLSNVASKGTTYHEAFHTVFNTMLDASERNKLLKEAKVKYGKLDNISLEEKLAEDFREFVLNGGVDTRSLGQKIVDFFKSLFTKTLNWKTFQPYSISYFRNITGGKYQNTEIKIYSDEMVDILSRASRDSKGKLLAPNRKESNLTERQYAQVRTKAFKEWFGDWENDPQNSSKVIDENGEPKVVYHGTDSNFNVFDKSFNDPGSNGFFSTDDSDMARSYGDNVMPLFLNIRDAYIVTGKGKNWNKLETDIFNIIPKIENQIQVHQIAMKRLLDNNKITQENYDFWLNKYYEKASFIKDKNRNSILDIIRKYIYKWQIRNFKASMLVDRTRDFESLLQELGEEVNIIFNDITDYGPNGDSFSGAHNVYVTTNPNNIKSADTNIGTYSKESNDIRYRKIDNTLMNSLSTEIKNTLLNKGWTQEKFDSISQQERDKAVECLSL